MDLSPKALRFLIEAVNHYAEHLERRLEEPGLSEDDLADLANDRQCLVALGQDLHSHHEDLVKGSVAVQN